MTRETVSFASEPAVDGSTITGIAHAFGSLARVKPGQYEQFAPTAFNKVLQTADVRAFVEHDRRLILGRMSAGTLRLSAEDDGLHYGIDLPNTTYANDLKESLARKDVTEMSFSFLPGKFEMRKAPDGLPIRYHTEAAELYDVSPVTIPAFTGTSAELRSLQDEESIKSQTIRARSRVHRANKE